MCIRDSNRPYRRTGSPKRKITRKEQSERVCPDKISFDAFKTELEAKVKELNEKYPKTMPLKISSGSGFIYIDQDTKTHNNGCDKPVAYFFIYRVKRIYRFSERPQIEKKGGAE